MNYPSYENYATRRKIEILAYWSHLVNLEKGTIGFWNGFNNVSQGNVLQVNPYFIANRHKTKNDPFKMLSPICIIFLRMSPNTNCPFILHFTAEIEQNMT